MEYAEDNVIEIDSVQPMLVRVAGKIDESRVYDGNYYSKLITPAIDEYSSPSVVEVRSRRSLGTVGDVVDIFCNLGGYRAKSYTYVDKQTNEKVTRNPVNLTLQHVE